MSRAGRLLRDGEYIGSERDVNRRSDPGVDIHRIGEERVGHQSERQSEDGAGGESGCVAAMVNSEPVQGPVRESRYGENVQTEKAVVHERVHTQGIEEPEGSEGAVPPDASRAQVQC